MKPIVHNYKQSILSAFALLILFAFSSCSGVIDIQKRHYRKGFYVNAGRASTKPGTLPVLPGKMAPPLQAPIVLPKVQQQVLSLASQTDPGTLVSFTKENTPKQHTPKISNLKSHVSGLRAVRSPQATSLNKPATKPVDDPEKERNHTIAGIIFLVAGLLLIIGIVMLPMEAAGLVLVASGAALVAGLSYFFKKTKKQEDREQAKEKAEPQEEEEVSHAKIEEEKKIDRIGKRVAIAFGIAFALFALAFLALIVYLLAMIGSGWE